MPHYTEMLDDNMGWGLQKRVLDADYDDQGLTEDLLQTHNHIY